MAIFGFFKKRPPEEEEKKKGLFSRGAERAGGVGGAVAGIFRKKKKEEVKEEVEPVAAAESAGVYGEVGAAESKLAGMLVGEREKGERRTQAFESAKKRREAIATGEMEPYKDVKVDSEDRLHYDSLLGQVLELLKEAGKGTPEYARASVAYLEGIHLEREGKIGEAIEKLESIPDILEEQARPEEAAPGEEPKAGGLKKFFGRGKGIVPGPAAPEMKREERVIKPEEPESAESMLARARKEVKRIPSGTPARKHAEDDLVLAMSASTPEEKIQYAQNVLYEAATKGVGGPERARLRVEGVAGGEAKRLGREEKWPFRRVGQQTIEAELAYWVKLREEELLMEKGTYVLRPEERKVLVESIKLGVPIVGIKEVLVSVPDSKGGLTLYQQKQTKPYPKPIAEVKVDMGKIRIGERELKEKVWKERVEHMKPVSAAVGGLMSMGKVQTKMSLPSPTGPAVPSRVYTSMATAGGTPAAMSMAPSTKATTQLRRATIGMGGRAGAAMMIPAAQSKALSVLPARRKRRVV